MLGMLGLALLSAGHCGATRRGNPLVFLSQQQKIFLSQQQKAKLWFVL